MDFLNIDESQFENPNKQYVEIGEVSPETIKIAQKNDIDLTGYVHIVDMSGKNHFKNGHILITKNDEIPLSEDE